MWSVHAPGEFKSPGLSGVQPLNSPHPKILALIGQAVWCKWNAACPVRTNLSLGTSGSLRLLHLHHPSAHLGRLWASTESCLLCMGSNCPWLGRQCDVNGVLSICAMVSGQSGLIWACAQQAAWVVCSVQAQTASDQADSVVQMEWSPFTLHCLPNQGQEKWLLAWMGQGGGMGGTSGG